MSKWTLSSFFLILLVLSLSAASYSDGSWDYKLPDEIGNLFKTKEKKDRKYGKAGQLLRDEKYSYSYDEVGNLIEKSSIAETWKYKWTQGGMLKKVIRPDRKHVDFTYDSLGRRLIKTYQDQTTHFVWDGNVPLHEWTSGVDDVISHVKDKGERETITPENLTTWVFEDGTFIPMAKMQGEKSYSIITDYLGTPTEAYDEEGEKVWSRQLNIYGETRKETGFENFVPFLYQGQYLDTETELAYNRYRYYSAESGIYVSQDPIGLDGEMPNAYSYVKDLNSWIDPIGLTADPYGGYFSRKDLRTQAHNSQRPGSESVHSTKHIRATSDGIAQDLSKKGLGGKPEASYLQHHLDDFNNFEKSSAFKGIKQGNVVQRGGGNMFIFYKHTSPVGYNNGKLTNWMRIEITSGTIHSQPADPGYVKKKLSGC